MVAARNYLVSLLKDAGIKSQVYGSLKKLKLSNESHVGAVLRNGETFERSGSKKTFVDQEGRRNRREKLWTRTASYNVVIGDTDEEKVDAILTEFFRRLKKGIPDNGNWVDIEPGEVEWVEKNDSILKANVAVQFEVTCRGGIYEDRRLEQKRIETALEKQGGHNEEN